MPTDTDTSLSWLRIAREWRGMTQRQLAAEAEITQGMLSRFENGRRQPRLALAVRLAKCLDVEVEALFPEDGPEPMDLLVDHFARRNGGKKRKAKR